MLRRTQDMVAPHVSRDSILPARLAAVNFGSSAQRWAWSLPAGRSPTPPSFPRRETFAQPSFSHPPAVVPAKAGIQGGVSGWRGLLHLHNLALRGELCKGLRRRESRRGGCGVSRSAAHGEPVIPLDSQDSCCRRMCAHQPPPPAHSPPTKPSRSDPPCAILPLAPTGTYALAFLQQTRPGTEVPMPPAKTNIFLSIRSLFVPGSTR